MWRVATKGEATVTRASLIIILLKSPAASAWFYFLNTLRGCIYRVQRNVVHGTRNTQLSAASDWTSWKAYKNPNFGLTRLFKILNIKSEFLKLYRKLSRCYRVWHLCNGLIPKIKGHKGQEDMAPPAASSINHGVAPQRQIATHLSKRYRVRVFPVRVRCSCRFKFNLLQIYQNVQDITVRREYRGEGGRVSNRKSTNKTI